jgi:DNA-binding CsgD family transcriptional regulator
MTSDNYLTKIRKKMGDKNKQILLFSDQRAALKRHNISE